MNRKRETIGNCASAPEQMERRLFLAKGTLVLATLVLKPFFARATFAAAAHRYKLAPESLLPADIRKAPVEVREAYRFAIANRDTFYATFLVTAVAGNNGTPAMPLVTFQDNSTPEKPVFDRMSLG